MNGEALRALFKFDFSAVKSLRREILGVLIIISSSFLFYQAVYLKNVSELARVESGMTDTRAEIDRIKAEISAAEELKRTVSVASVNLVRLEDRLATLKERLPSDKHISKILAEISDIRNDVRIVSIKPLPAEDKGELTRLPFQISLETRFNSMGNYIERIENLPRIIVVDNFMIEAKADEPVLTLQMYFSAYILTSNRI